jgi:nitrate/nitrite-specific signal transduction histidine kinase
MEQVTEDVPHVVVKPRTTLTDAQFKKALEQVAQNGKLKDGVTHVSDWLLADVDLTPDQDAELQQLLNVM